MEHRHKVFNLIILDESGSMASIKQTAINGFNEVIQTVKEVGKQYPEQDHIVSLVTFNGLGIKTLHLNEPVGNISEIDAEKYVPASMTPLYDAMGHAISAQRQEAEKHVAYNVLVTILTDGEENSSKEYTANSIKKLVEELKTKNWTFTYIGANHDVEKFAVTISINNTMTFQANDADMKQMFEREKSARMSYSKKIRGKEDVSTGFYDPDTKA